MGISELVITNNTSLSSCAIASVCDYLDITASTATINNNGTNCNTRQEIENACLTLIPTITIQLPNTNTTILETTTNSFTYTFERSGGDLTSTLKVEFQLTGTADDDDFTITTGGTGMVNYTTGTKKGDITFPANATTVELTITPKSDNIVESNETLGVKIILPSG